MTFVMVNEGRNYLLGIATAPYYGRLWKAPTDSSLPIPTAVGSDYTEADFSGYGYKALGLHTQLIPSGVNASVKTGAVIDFVHNGGATDNDIYGFITELNGSTPLSDTTELGASQITMTPMENIGDRISIKFNLWCSGDASNPDTPTVEFNHNAEIHWCNEFYSTNLNYRVVQLFTSNITPSETDTLATYSEYLGAAVSPTFSAGATTVGGIATKISDHMHFRQDSNVTPAITVYGYIYYNTYSSIIYGAEKFASPIDYSHIGDEIIFSIKCSVWSLV